jgi:hypothetical protein
MSKISVQKVEQASLPSILPLLSEHDPSVSAELWSALFRPAWAPVESFCGYGLFDGEEAVGFLGAVFSQRVFDGQVEKLCNLTTWVVKPQYRAHSISLLLPFFKLKDHTLVDLSPTGGVVAICKRLGFQTLDSSIVHDRVAIAERLDADERRLLADHTAYNHCRHLLVEAKGQRCYVVYTCISRAPLRYGYIQHISNLPLFAQYNLAIRQQIAQTAAARLVVVDARLVQGVNLPLCWDLPVEVIRLYRSTRLKPEQIDNLYSELIALDFNPVPIEELSLPALKQRLLRRVLVMKNWLPYSTNAPFLIKMFNL